MPDVRASYPLADISVSITRRCITLIRQLRNLLACGVFETASRDETTADSFHSGCHIYWWRFANRWFALATLTTRMAAILVHRDTKLGLALAILVMGFAAALCFPRQSSEQPVDLTLQSAADLDQAIRLMPVKSYTDADRPAPRGTELAPVESTPLETPVEVLPLAGVPDPIQNTGEPEPTPIDPGSLPAEIVAPTEPEPVVHTRTYRVVNGDSLSLIAERELGSHKYWSTLFNANRHLLRTENDLKPGMELTIPIESGDEVTPAPQNPVPTVSTQAASQAVTPNAPALPLRSDMPASRASGRFSPGRTRVGASGTAPKPQ